MQPMLAHSDRDRRQLGHLTPKRLGDINTLAIGENVRARPAAVGPMLNDLVDLLGRKQPPGTGPRARAGRHASCPTPRRAHDEEPTEDPATAAATSSANSDPDDARARQP